MSDELLVNREFLRDGDLRLRALEPSDAALMAAVENDSSQWMLNGMSAPMSMKLLADYAENYDADPIRAGQIRLVAECMNRPVGIVDLYEISALRRTAFAAIYIMPAHRRKGYGSRALALLEEYGHTLLHLRIFAVKTAEKNSESIALFTSCGYKKSGTLPDWMLTGNTTQDLLIFTKSLS